MPTTNYIWDELNDTVLMETDASGSPTTVYTNEPGQFGGLISSRQGGQSQYYHFDGIGSTRQLTNSAGQVTDSYLYDAFGNTIQSTGTSVVPYHFVGRQGYYLDQELGQYYVRARQFQPNSGQWTSIDPLCLTDDAVWLSEDCPGRTYGYGDPVSYIDPSGKIRIQPITVGKGFVPACGKPVQMKWWFFLEKSWGKYKKPGAPCNGFIVQKVIVIGGISPPCRELRRGEGPVTPGMECPMFGFQSFSYFEAWPVKRGQKRIDVKGRPGYTDDAEYSSVNNTCGFCEQFGEVRFYCRECR